MQTVILRWRMCKSYSEAEDCANCIYLHEGNGMQYYWGKCDKSIFGGNRRIIPALARLVNPRYGRSYRHWIDGALAGGSRLFIATCYVPKDANIDKVEQTLIHNFPTKHNGTNAKVFYVLRHEGDVPDFLRDSESPRLEKEQKPIKVC